MGNEAANEWDCAADETTNPVVPEIVAAEAEPTHDPLFDAARVAARIADEWDEPTRELPADWQPSTSEG